jgi:hypothetical protein
MRENPALVAIGAAYAGDRRGTPAGNSGISQEQHAYLRAHRLSFQDIETLDMLVPAAPPCPGEIPEAYRAQAELVEVTCPVVATRLVGSDWLPIVLMPTGELCYPAE